MYSDFINLIRTTEEVDLLSEEIHLITDSLYKGGQNNLNDVFNSQIRAKFSVIFRELLSNSKEPKETLEELDELLQNMETFKLTIAFEPTDSFIDKLILYIRASAGNNLVLDISTDPAVGGGAIISYKGEYRDFSLTKFMDFELTTRREEIIELLEEKTKHVVAEPQ